MGFSTYPTAADVENLMKSTSYWPADDQPAQQELAQIQCVIAAEAAKDEWEHFSGWTPFLAGENYTTRYFNSVDHTGYLAFKSGAVDVQSFSIGGIVQSLNQNYYLHPDNAIEEGDAIKGLNVGYNGSGSSQYSAPRRFAVTARWGRVTEVPGDVWQAVQQKAASIVLTQIPNLQSVASISQDGFTKAYDIVGIVTQKDLAAGGIGGAGIWGRSFDTIAKRWKRVVI